MVKAIKILSECVFNSYLCLLADEGHTATWGQYFKFVIFFIACSASRLWTTFLGIAILFQTRYKRCLSNRVQIGFYIIGVM